MVYIHVAKRLTWFERLCLIFIRPEMSIDISNGQDPTVITEYKILGNKLFVTNQYATNIPAGNLKQVIEESTP